MNKTDDKNRLDNEEKIISEQVTELSNHEIKEDELNKKENFDNDDLKNDEEPPIEESLKEEISKLRDEKLRLLADMENLRKRSEKERIDSIRYGSMNLARDILSPDDNLSRALNTVPQDEKNTETVNNLIDGLKMVQKEFSTILEKYGIKKIKALNKKFDHNFHQAMVEIEDDDSEEGIVIQEMQSGYTMHDRLLRPSMVGVSKKKPENKENQETSKKKT